MKKSVFVMVAGLLPVAAHADPADITCRFLAVMGSNQAEQVEPMLKDIAPRFEGERLESATNTLRSIAAGAPFAGGSAWTVLSLGEDLEEHLVLFRLKEGELAGSLLRYEWSPEGLALTNIEFHRQFADYVPDFTPTAPTAIDCS